MAKTLTSKDFEEFRFCDLMKAKAQPGELFFTISPRGEKADFPYSLKKYGYLKIGPVIQKIISQTFTGCDGIEFIEWKDCWNVIFEERSIIGNISYRMSFEEFSKLFG
ncbi:hypothetical protein SAMN05216391_10941 [Lachnospiraceae bacterium KHCPX20]|nr:hypothetical protein SAMN05216391_10941 [Lachnospiraceae bacterium KHCPX20]